MEQITRSISFSEYSTYINCPHKWYLTYGLRYPGDISEELIFGSAVHNTIENILTNKHVQRMYRLNKENTIRDVFKGFLKDELQKIENENFLKMFAEKKLANIFFWQASSVILSLNFFERFKNYTIEHVELKLDGLTIYETETKKITFKGFIDLILKNKETGKYLILDWKTSRKAWDIIKKMKDNENFFAQLCLYKKFFSQSAGIPFELIETKFYNLCRDEPNLQSPYAGVLTKEYIDLFYDKFLNTAIQIYDHAQSLTSFKKVKHITNKNFCFRCHFNNAKFCNEVDEFQIVGPPPIKPTQIITP